MSLAEIKHARKVEINNEDGLYLTIKFFSDGVEVLTPKMKEEGKSPATYSVEQGEQAIKKYVELGFKAVETAAWVEEL